MILHAAVLPDHCGYAWACAAGAQELRMVRAIARLALCEAARHGEYHASFHGFAVDALRASPAAGADISEVVFRVSHRAILVERGVALVSAAQTVMPRTGCRLGGRSSE